MGQLKKDDCTNLVVNLNSSCQCLNYSLTHKNRIREDVTMFQTQIHVPLTSGGDKMLLGNHCWGSWGKFCTVVQIC